MATLRSLVYLLYTARTRFDSLTATLHYEYLPRALRRVIDEWREGRYGPKGATYLRAKRRQPPADQWSHPERQTARETLVDLAAEDGPVRMRWGFWLKKPTTFRHDILGGNRSSVLVINGEQSMFYGESRRPRITTVEPSTALRRAEDFLFIDPSPLLAAHDLTQLSECSFLDREALRFRAIPRNRERVSIDDNDFFCAGDYYDVVVDLERGVLLKYAAVKGDMVYAEARAKAVAFDEPLDESVFSIPPQEEGHFE